MSISLDVNLNLPETPKGVPEELFTQFRILYNAIRNLGAYISTLATSLAGETSVRGKTTLVAGTKAVANTSVTANTVVFCTVQALGTVAAPKAIHVVVSAGVGFTITSEDVTDTSVVAWMFFPS